MQEIPDSIKDLLQDWQEDFEFKFDSVIEMDFLNKLPSPQTIDDIQSQRVEFIQVGGEGDTAKKAVDDFKSKFIQLEIPKAATLVWRVKPEITCDKDFDTKKYTWRVYARFGFYKELVANG